MATAGNSIDTNPDTNQHGLVGLSVQEENRAAFYRHLMAYVLVNAGLATLNLTRNPNNPWFLWVIGGWGIGIVCHAIKVFLFPDSGPKHLR